MKQAVCVLLINSEGQVLACSRRGNPNDMGLPGGKVDPGELPADACVRETYEETGIKIWDLSPVFQRVCVGEVSYDTITYTAKYEGTPAPKEPGIDVRWVCWSELLRKEASFSEYNNALYNSLRAPQGFPPGDGDFENLDRRHTWIGIL